MANVKLLNLSKSYEKNQLTINNISLDIKDKEFIVLVGPSGCGKSTALRMIAGLEDITHGEIYIDDKLVNNVHPKDRNIAMVFQNYALYPHMNVYDNMAFGLKMRKVPKDIINKKVLEVANILNLEDLLNRKPKQLSGGQRQRVALGRAIVRDPQAFLMDEPLSNLDAKLRVQMRSEIKKLHQKLQTTFIYVTHDQVEAMTMGDRIVILNGGIIQQVDTPENVYNNPVNVFVASFIGSPAMNFIRAKVISANQLTFDKHEIFLSDSQINIVEKHNLINKDVILGIRPEHFLSEVNQGAFINITPNLVEMLGSEKLVHFKIADKSIAAKVSPECEVQADVKCTLSLNMSKALLFDSETQLRY